MTPFPSFPQIQSTDLGEGELRLFMKTLSSSKVNGLRELQSASGEELSALMASVLDKAFKGEL